MFETIPLKDEHLEDAALLVSRRYQRLCEQIPHLPNRYAQMDTLLPLLQNIQDAAGTGVAAIRGNRLVGFLTGWQMPSFRGKRSTYSPEWANAADPEDSAHIYEEMYSQLADAWVEDKYVAHYISLALDGFWDDLSRCRPWFGIDPGL